MQKGAQETEDPCRNEPVQTLVETLQKELDRKQGIIESLIAQNEAQRQRTDTILMKLTTDISSLQKALEFRSPEPAKKEPLEETRTSSALESRRADPRQIVSPLAVKMPPVQRELSTWESVQLTFNDFAGFLFGHG